MNTPHGLLDLFDKTERVLGIVLTTAIMQDWVNQINTGAAIFVKQRGPRKLVFVVKHEGKDVEVGYVPESQEIKRVYSVNGQKRLKTETSF